MNSHAPSVPVLSVTTVILQRSKTETEENQTQFRRSLKTHVPWLKAAHLCQQKGPTGMELNIETFDANNTQTHTCIP